MKLTQKYASPNNFCGEAIRHVICLLNHLPTKVLDTRTPHELCCGKKPHFEHVRDFDCTTYVTTTRPHIKKFDDKSQNMVYFSMEDGTKEHRRYDPQYEKNHVGRDILLEEEKK